jgi:RNA polymerase sigma factor (sigma-70 family)
VSGKTATAGPVVDRTDSELVTAVRGGDDRAFEQLYERYHTRIAAYVRGMVKDQGRAEDVTQEVFFSAVRRMRETERPIAFKPWVYEIARNACIDQFRRTSRAEELSYDAEGGLASADHVRLVATGPTPDAAVDAKQRLDQLCGAFGGLSDAHHEILVMRELEGLSYREIGERLGMSRPAVESTLFRARRRLTEEYDELVSGRRCQRVQSIIAAAAEGMVGARDRQRLARHVSHCQPCRRHARLLGVEAPPARTLGARLAALLPLPAFLRRGREGEGVPGPAGGQSSSLAQLSSSLGAAAEPVAATWTKAVATLAALAVASVGAGVAGHRAGLPIPGPSDLPVVGALQGPDRGDERGGPESTSSVGLGVKAAPGATAGPLAVAPFTMPLRWNGAAAANGGPRRSGGGGVVLPGGDVVGGSGTGVGLPLPGVPVPNLPARSGSGDSGGGGLGDGVPSRPPVNSSLPDTSGTVKTPEAPTASVPASTPEEPQAPTVTSQVPSVARDLISTGG